MLLRRIAVITLGFCLVATGLLSLGHDGNTATLLDSKSLMPPQKPAGVSASPAFQPSMGYSVGNLTLGPVGVGPNATELDTRTGDVLITLDPSYLGVVSSVSRSLVTTVDVGNNTYPDAIAFDDATNEIYVATEVGGVTVVSGLTYAVVAHIQVGETPVGIVYDNATGDLWVENAGVFYPNRTTSPEISVISGATRQVIANLSLYAEVPLAIGFDYMTREVILAGIGFTLSGYVFAVNDITRTLAWTNTNAGFNNFPESIACDFKTGEIFVSSASGSVNVFAGGTGRGTTVIHVDGSPTGLTYDNRSDTVYMGNYGLNAVFEINGSTHAVVGSTAVRGGPGGVAYSYVANSVFVADSASQAVSLINLSSATMSTTIAVAASPFALSYDTALQSILVVGADRLLVIDEQSHSVVGSANVGFSPQGVVYANSTGEIYVTNSQSNTVTVLSGTSLTVMDSVPVDSFPIGIAYDVATGNIFVACWAADVVDVISAESDSVVSRIAVGPGPNGVVIDDSAKEVFVTEEDNDNVAVISTQTLRLVGSIALPYYTGPTGIAIDPVTNQLYVAGLDRGSVNVVSLTSDSVIANISVGGAPFGVVYDPQTSEVLVSNACAELAVTVQPSCQNNVTIISPTLHEVEGTVSTGSSPVGETYSPETGVVYVANYCSGNLTTLTPSSLPHYTITFSESGLVGGTNWSVSLNNASESGANSTVVFSNHTRGTYVFVVAMVTGYWATPASGLAFIVDGPALIKIAFEPLSAGMYLVTFGQSGLPLGRSWTVNLSGDVGPVPERSFGPYASVPVVNGTFSWSAGENGSYYPWPASQGQVIVRGRDVSVSLIYTIVYLTTFNELGLPTSTQWTLEAMTAQTSRGSSSLDPSWFANSTTTSAALYLANGSYSYTLSAPGYPPTLGTFEVNGQPVTTTVTVLPGHSGPGAVWWPWAVIGVGVAGGAIGLVVTVLRGRNPAS